MGSKCVDLIIENSLLAFLTQGQNMYRPDHREQSVSFLNAGSKYVDLIVENGLLDFLTRGPDL